MSTPAAAGAAAGAVDLVVFHNLHAHAHQHVLIHLGRDVGHHHHGRQLVALGGIHHLLGAVLFLLLGSRLLDVGWLRLHVEALAHTAGVHTP